MVERSSSASDLLSSPGSPVATPVIATEMVHRAADECCAVWPQQAGFFVGINCGHHEATARVLDRSTRTCTAHSYKESLNIHAIGVGQTTSRLSSFLKSIGADLAMSHQDVVRRITHVVIAFPGAGLAHDHELCRKAVTPDLPGVSFQIVDDTWAGLYAELLSRTGICAFAGTGASVSVSINGFRQGKEYKIDGWGPLIGDFGSGFQLVTNFFRSLGRKFDRNRPSALFPAIQAFCATGDRIGIESLDRVQAWFDDFVRFHGPEWRAHFSELAAPILDAADNRSDVSPAALQEAQRLVTSCATSMHKSITYAINRFDNLPTPLPIVLQGGLFRNSRLYTDTVIRLLAHQRQRPVRVATMRPVDGALLLACEPYNLLAEGHRCLQELHRHLAWSPEA